MTSTLYNPAFGLGFHKCTLVDLKNNPNKDRIFVRDLLEITRARVVTGLGLADSNDPSAGNVAGANLPANPNGTVQSVVAINLTPAENPDLLDVLLYERDTTYQKVQPLFEYVYEDTYVWVRGNNGLLDRQAQTTLPKPNAADWSDQSYVAKLESISISTDANLGDLTDEQYDAIVDVIPFYSVCLGLSAPCPWTVPSQNKLGHGYNRIDPHWFLVVAPWAYNNQISDVREVSIITNPGRIDSDFVQQPLIPNPDYPNNPFVPRYVTVQHEEYARGTINIADVQLTGGFGSGSATHAFTGEFKADNDISNTNVPLIPGVILGGEVYTVTNMVFGDTSSIGLTFSREHGSSDSFTSESSSISFVV